MSTLFCYYNTNGKIILSEDFSHEIVIKILNAYAQQHACHSGGKEDNNEDKSGMIIMSLMLNEVLNEMEIRDILVSF